MRRIDRLSALAVSRLKEPGRYADGGGLVLQISVGGARSWILRYSIQRLSPVTNALETHRREMGLGSVQTVSLANARERAAEARRQILDGIDPLEARAQRLHQSRIEAARAITFEMAASRYIEAHKAGWRSDKHAMQWTATLATYAYPTIGSMPVNQIDVAAIMTVLSSIWETKTETASRVRGRIESILDWARVQGLREGDNPARWRGHLDKLLPRRSKVKKVRHHRALPFDEISSFMLELRKQQGVAPRALEFIVLTACRATEGLKAVWSEIDLKKKTWTVPGDRIKAGREHRVPLSTPAIALLEDMMVLRPATGEDSLVFPGLRKGKPLSATSLLKVLRQLNCTDATVVHGLRSTFRDWAAEVTNYPREAAEMALAHAVGDKVEAAYRRGDLFHKRALMMEDWATFCDTPRPKGDVVDLADQRTKALRLR